MKAKNLSLLLPVLMVLYFSAQAQIPSSFFGMTAHVSGSAGSLTVQYPLQTITTIDTNFTTSPVGTLAHPSNFAWGWVETSQNTYDWSLIDPELLAAHNQGVNMILTIAWTPGWAAGTGSGTCTTKTNYGVTATLCSKAPSATGSGSDWANFITKLMDHLYGLGYTNPVTYIELWNEANTTGFWGPSTDSGYGISTLVAMAQTAYPLIHNYSSCNHPTNTCPLVLTPSAVGAVSGPVPGSGSTDNIVSDWIGKYLAAAYTASGNTSFYADGIAFHGYLHTADLQHAWPESYWTSSFGNCTLGNICNSGPSYRTCPNDGTTVCFGPLDTLVTSIRTAATNAGASTSMPLIDTEGGWGSGDLDLASSDQNPPLPLDTAYAARWYLLQAGLGSTSNLKVASWYFWNPTCTSGCRQGDYGELGYVDSSGNLIPFGTAGKTSAPGSGLGIGWLWKWLKGSTISSPCAPATQNTSIWSCSLTLSNGDGARIVWYTPSGSATYTNSNFSYYQNLTGCFQPYTTHITVNQGPVIVLTKDEGWGKNTCQ
jgi:hypothetical protein